VNDYDKYPATAVLDALDLYRGRVQSYLDAKTTGEREALQQRLITDMKEDRPEIIEGIAEFNRSGILLLMLVSQAFEHICDRKDFSQADKDDVASHAQEFMSIFNAVSDSPSGICPRELVFRFGEAALLIGLSVGLSPDKVRAWKQKGGRNSGSTRRAKRQWAAHAEELAVAAYAHDPEASNDTIAVEIASCWKLKEVDCPGHRTLCDFVSDQKKRGRLQRT
jgi:hypothetical protein